MSQNVILGSMEIWREYARDIAPEGVEEDLEANTERMNLMTDEVSRLNEEEIEAELMRERDGDEDSNEGED
jgi:hypothetical protein